MKTISESDAMQADTDCYISKKRVKLYHYGHSRAVFCCRACREGFKADRQSGLIYGPYWMPEHNRFAMCAEEASALMRFCPYCGQKEGQPT